MDEIEIDQHRKLKPNSTVFTRRYFLVIEMYNLVNIVRHSHSRRTEKPDCYRVKHSLQHTVQVEQQTDIVDVHDILHKTLANRTSSDNK